MMQKDSRTCAHASLCAVILRCHCAFSLCAVLRVWLTTRTSSSPPVGAHAHAQCAANFYCTTISHCAAFVQCAGEVCVCV